MMRSRSLAAILGGKKAFSFRSERLTPPPYLLGTAPFMVSVKVYFVMLSMFCSSFRALIGLVVFGLIRFAFPILLIVSVVMIIKSAFSDEEDSDTVEIR